MAETETTAKPSGSFLSRHKGPVIGGVAALVLGVGYYFYDKSKKASSTSSSTAASTYYVNPALTQGTPEYSAVLAANSAFAGQLANDFASNYSNLRGGGSGHHYTKPETASQPNGNNVTPNIPPASSPPAPVAAQPATNTVSTQLGQGAATEPANLPSSVTVSGVKFAPTQQVQVGSVTYYGIPNATVAASLKKKGAAVQSLFGGKGLYVAS